MGLFLEIFSHFKATLLLCLSKGVLAQWNMLYVIHLQGSLALWWIIVLHHHPKGWQERKCFKQTSLINCFNPNARKKWLERVWMSRKTLHLSALYWIIYTREQLPNFLGSQDRILLSFWKYNTSQHASNGDHSIQQHPKGT